MGSRAVGGGLVHCALFLLPLHAQAQSAPNAGQTLQQLQPRLQAPASPPPALDLPAAPTPRAVAPGGPTVEVQTITLEGNTVFSADELLALLSDARGGRFDLAGLRGLADRITRHYQQAGYPYAYALIPAQTLRGGGLRIQIVEGRYGKVVASGPRADQAQPWLDALRPGEVIALEPLEDTVYRLSSLPGVRVSPSLGAGARPGEGDLDVAVDVPKPYGGALVLDNTGNRYTGAYRVSANLWADSLLVFGDRAVFDGLVTDEALWLGSVDYAAPLGTSGLRGELRYSRTSYQLGKDFKDLDAEGVADTMSVGLSYPLVRGARGGVTLALAYQHKRLRDDVNLLDSHSDTTSDSLPVSLRFDWRDALGEKWGGGVTYGSLVWTLGDLDLDPAQRALDQVTARTQGRFRKLALDVTRLQALPMGLTSSTRIAAQWAGKNLNSSESFGLGGNNGVRAYPQGEGYGDTGWLFQGELRYDAGMFAPYAFYDAGYVKINQNPWAPGRNHRTLQGAGVGVRWDWGRWSADLSAAWRLSSEPQSDTQDRKPRVWASLSYRLF